MATAGGARWARLRTGLHGLGERIDALGTRSLLVASGLVLAVLLVAVAATHVIATPAGGLGGVTVRDELDAPDRTPLTEAAEGRPWVLHGSWVEEDGAARVVAAGPLREAASAVVDVGSTDVLVVVEAGVVVDGWGVAVRYQDAEHLVAVVGVPSFGGYRVVAVEDGNVRELGRVPLASSQPGTELTVVLSGDQLVVLVDRVPRAPIAVPDTPQGTSVGLYALPRTVPTASWRSFFVQTLGGAAGLSPARQ